MKLVIADDSAVMRKIVIRTLRQVFPSSLDVVEAGDGAELVGLVGEHQPDLVLSDWNMPNMTGIQALQAIRATGSTVPFGFITSETSEAMREKATGAGADFLLAKPFTRESVEEALAAYI